MNNQEISRQIQKLNALFDRTREASAGDIEIQSHWAKYLCVLCAGLLENAICELYIDFCGRAASPPVVSFADTFLSEIQNPKTDKFLKVASSFKRLWGQQLEAFIDEEGRKDAINSIMGERHNIAHGKNSAITISRLRGYLDKSIEVLEFIETQCET